MSQGKQAVSGQAAYSKDLQVISQVKGQTFHWNMQGLDNPDSPSFLHRKVQYQP